MQKFILILCVGLSSLNSINVFALPTNYQKDEILYQRFGNKERQDLLAKALKIRGAINKKVVGQAALAAAIQIRIYQYINSVGTRKNEPMALHMIGLPGVGKTSILSVLQELGLPVYRIDAQNFQATQNGSAPTYQLMSAIEDALKLKKSKETPLILFIDELDKVPEILSMTKENSEVKEINQPVITSLNEILSDGTLSNPYISGRSIDFSNVFILTAMNFSPAQLEKFALESLGSDKSFWDFKEADMAKFDQWIRSSDSGPSATAKILALLFRANTISRMIPDSVVAKSLYKDDFDQIVQQNILEVIDRLSSPGQKIEVEHTPAFKSFLRRVAVYAPSGARVSVKRVDLLVEQLIAIALNSNLNDPASMALPRRITLGYNSKSKSAEVRIEAQTLLKGKLNTKTDFTFNVSYDFSTNTFIIPENAISPLPTKLATAADQRAKHVAEKKLSVTQIREQREKLQNDHLLKRKIEKVIFGQAELAEELDRGLHLYMNSSEPAVRKLIIPGFVGVGKTAIVLASAEALGIEVVRFNMQHYSGDAQESADRFGEDLFKQIESAKRKSKDGKFILLIEEIDKTFEINPMNGEPVPRPVMSVVKDILDKGKRTVTLKTDWETEQKVVDVTQGYTVVSMNFATDRYEVHADPRLTTIEDMQDLYQQIVSSPDEIRSLLTSMFLPDTANRLLSSILKFAKPLDNKGFENILKQQVQIVMQELSSAEGAKKNHGAMTVKMTPAYFQEYLKAESVIPSEGERQASDYARLLLRRDIVDAVSAIPKSSDLFNHPIEIELHFTKRTKSKPAQVIASAIRTDKKSDLRSKKSDSEYVELYQAKRHLRFPPLKAQGKLSQKRVLTAVHEFGHAFTAVLHGLRIERAVAVTPSPNLLGYVKEKKVSEVTGRILLAQLVTGLGSIALERIFLAADSKSPESVLDTTPGPSQDIRSATKLIWKIIHKLGMDPFGGVIERSGLMGDHHELYDRREFFFAELPDEKVTQLSFVLRDLVNNLVQRLLSEHSLDWYRDKILTFAVKGELDEKELYQLIEHEYPGDNNIFIGENMGILNTFGDYLVREPTETTSARKFKSARTALSKEENMQITFDAFVASVKRRLHPGKGSCEDVLQ